MQHDDSFANVTEGSEKYYSILSCLLIKTDDSEIPREDALISRGTWLLLDFINFVSLIVQNVLEY